MTFSAQKDMNKLIAVPNPGLADVLDALFEAGLSGATRLVVVGGRIDLEHTTGPAD